MTAGNNGASTPEDDDPFGYLYEDGQAAAAAQGRQGGYGYPGPAAQPGVPRTSYNQVRAVGERQYGQQPQVPQQQAPPYGQQQPQYGQQQAPYGGYGQQPNGSAPGGPYASPEAHHASATTGRVPLQRGGGRGRGPNTKGLLIGAIAVVAVVVIGITAALVYGGDDTKKNNDAAPAASPSATQSQQPSDGPSKEADKPAALPKQDAATLQLTPPATVASDIPGAKGANGAYALLTQAGAAVEWNLEVPKAGDYTLNTMYGVPGKDANATLAVNGTAQSRPINMANFAKAPEGAWDKGWTKTWSNVQLKAGSNTIQISCQAGNQCNVALDQVSLDEGWR